MIWRWPCALFVGATNARREISRDPRCEIGEIQVFQVFLGSLGILVVGWAATSSMGTPFLMPLLDKDRWEMYGPDDNAAVRIEEKCQCKGMLKP